MNDQIYCPYCGAELADRSEQCCGEVHGGTAEEIGPEVDEEQP